MTQHTPLSDPFEKRNVPRNSLKSGQAQIRAHARAAFACQTAAFVAYPLAVPLHIGLAYAIKSP